MARRKLVKLATGAEARKLERLQLLRAARSALDGARVLRGRAESYAAAARVTPIVEASARRLRAYSDDTRRGAEDAIAHALRCRARAHALKATKRPKCRSCG